MRIDYMAGKKEEKMKPNDKYKMKKRISAAIAIILAAAMVLSLIAPFLSYGIY